MSKTKTALPPYPIDPQNGYMVGPDGRHYDNEHQIHHFAHMGLCGCGTPQDAYNFVRDVLAKFDRRASRAGGEWIDAEKAVAALISERPEDAAHVLAHLLSERDLLEHGGSVGGSWLTPVGERIVDLGPMTDDALDPPPR